MCHQTSQLPNIRRIAIVGSGLAGLTSAILLQEQGHRVTVFEKSRGPGGRLASKRVNGGSTDMGAQYFTARNPAFLPFLRTWAGAESVAEWQGRFGFQYGQGLWESFPDEPRYVGRPRMTALSRGLSAHVEVLTGGQVGKLCRNHPGWALADSAGAPLGEFDQVIITAPPAQARELFLASGLEELAAELDASVQRVLPCWAVAAHFAEAPWQRHEGMRIEHPVLYWAANNSSKPGREDQGQWWVLHAAPGWSARNLELPEEQVAGAMIRAFSEITGSALTPDQVVTHRWLYARSEGGEQPGHLWFGGEGLGLAGDWLSGGRVEGAFNSACSLVAVMSPAR